MREAVELHDVLPPRPARRPARDARLRLRSALRRSVLFVGLLLVLVSGLGYAAHRRLQTPPRGAHNEAAAISRLRFIDHAQRQFTRARHVVLPPDSETGMPGSFDELSGAAPPPGSSGSIRPLLSGAFRSKNEDGTVDFSGYRFRLFIRSDDGRAVADLRIDASIRRSPRWCAYAWPQTYGNSGLHSIFTDESGRMFRADVPGYSGDAEPPPEAAFNRGGVGRFGTLGARVHTGQDGATWTELP